MLDRTWTGITLTAAFVSLSLCASLLFADAPRTIRAASCSQQHVQNAINVAQDGDIVLVPRGKAVWVTLAPKTPAVIIPAKRIALVGAGIGRTVIYGGMGRGRGESPLRIDGVDGKPFRITGFTFKAKDIRGPVQPSIVVQGTCRNWRIDHCRFEGFGSGDRGVRITGDSFGVIDNCLFNNLRAGVTIVAETSSWDKPLSLGTDRAVYVEDCIFDNSEVVGDALTAANGARFVFRANKLRNFGLTSKGLSQYYLSSVFSYEIYGNIIICSKPKDRFCVMEFGGGTGVIFNNRIKGFRQAFSVSNLRSCDDAANGRLGICDGKNPRDGNEDPSGYPACQQIGRSTGQTLEPLYEWKNSLNGRDADIFVNPLGSPRMAKHIQEKRDFYNDTPRPDYKPFAYPHPFRKSQVAGSEEPDKPGKTATPGFTDQEE